jgi:hypothetical protein
MSSGKLTQCSSCGGFIPAIKSSCPHCSSSSSAAAAAAAASPAGRSVFNRLRARALGGAFGGGAIAFTLMACYGAPPCEEPSCRDTNADGGDNETDGATGRDANRPDVIVTPKDDGGGSSSDGGNADAGNDSGDGG